MTKWKIVILDFVIGVVLSVGATYAVLAVNHTVDLSTMWTSIVISAFVGTGISAGFWLGRRAS